MEKRLNINKETSYTRSLGRSFNVK